MIEVNHFWSIIWSTSRIGCPNMKLLGIGWKYKFHKKWKLDLPIWKFLLAQTLVTWGNQNEEILVASLSSHPFTVSNNNSVKFHRWPSREKIKNFEYRWQIFFSPSQISEFYFWFSLLLPEFSRLKRTATSKNCAPPKFCTLRTCVVCEYANPALYIGSSTSSRVFKGLDFYAYAKAEIKKYSSRCPNIITDFTLLIRDCITQLEHLISSHFAIHHCTYLHCTPEPFPIKIVHSAMPVVTCKRPQMAAQTEL